MKKIEKTKRFHRIASLIAALGFIYFAFWLRFGFVPGPFVFIIVLSISIMFFIVPIFIPDKNSKTLNSDNENRKIVNKIIYFKKGFFLLLIIPAFIMLILALSNIIVIRNVGNDFMKSINPILTILYLFASLLGFIFTYQTIKLPLIIFKDDEIIQYIGVFRIKNKIKITDIKDFKNDYYCLAEVIIFTLKNNKIKRLYLYGISESDQEYIINLLKDRISKENNSKTLNSDSDNRRNNE